MGFTYSFEKLEAWKESKVLSKMVYKFTVTFPDYEKFGLVTQMRRAVISVCSNLAEGSSRISAKDQAHFYQIAYGSLMELLNQIIISGELGFIEDSIVSQSRDQIEKVSRMINALRNQRLNL
ncbi:MAG TPA: four helix bundle protein [Bacteroidales bacterium]|nr:four helix bundle protein [Bacteroidales bacterium]